MSDIELRNHIPVKYHSYIKSKPTKVTEITDNGIICFHGESNVKLITYEYGTTASAHTQIFPAIINMSDRGKLTQISVIIHF